MAFSSLCVIILASIIGLGARKKEMSFDILTEQL
jgi:hypothetical protein